MASDKDTFSNFTESVQNRIQRLLSSKQEMLLNNFVIAALWQLFGYKNDNQKQNGC